MNQIAAEVYARFRKTIPGASMWAIHTRDYRIHNPQACQILVSLARRPHFVLLFGASLTFALLFLRPDHRPAHPPDDAALAFALQAMGSEDSLLHLRRDSLYRRGRGRSGVGGESSSSHPASLRLAYSNVFFSQQLLIFCTAPIIGLSATVGEPEYFSA